MNNSSSNNVLLKTVQPSAAHASAARRNYQDDQSSSFQRHFQDVHESARAQNERPSKSIPKKVAPVDSSKSNNDIEKRRSVSAQESPEKRVPEKVKASDKNAGAKDKVTEQAPNPKVNEPADSEGLEPTKKAVKKSDAKNSQDNEQNSGITNPAVVPAPAVLKDSALHADVMVAGVTNVALINESDVSLPSAPIASASITPASVTQSPIKSDTILAAGSSTELMPALSTQIESSDHSPVSDTDKLAAKDVATIPNQQATTDPILLPLAQQAVTALSPDDQIDRPVAALAEGEAEVLSKSPATQLAPSGSMEEHAAVSDDEVSASPVSAAVESAIAKTSPKTTGDQGQATDPNQKQNPLLDSKASFEKALQNIVVSESAGRDAGTPSSTLQSSPATNGSPLDSMFRFGETNTPSSRGFVVQTAVPVPVGQPQWSQAVGEKVLWLAAQNVSSAEINLNPEHLGPVQVKVSVNQEQTSVSFTSHHAVVREVLDQNLGRLRDMFSEQGLNLVNVDVSDKSFSRQHGDAQHQGGQGAHQESSVEEEVPVAVSLIKQQRLVDHYA